MSEQAVKSRLFVVMGVSGCGKSSVASALAKAFNMHFIEADDYHSKLAKAQMAAGIPLTDDIRSDWIARLCQAVSTARKTNPLMILACSALRASHRQLLLNSEIPVTFLFLDGEKSVIADRLSRRAEHFFAPSLLDSQFNDLQTPGADEPVITININGTFDDVVSEAKRAVERALADD